jgi:cell wall-associated NlpC family hydrolase
VVPNITHVTPSAAAYELGIANVYSGTAVETATQRVRDLHNAEKHLRDIEQQVSGAAGNALTTATSAAAADKKAQIAANQAAAEQTRLIATLNQVQGDLATLVAIQKASLAVAAYTKISQAANLLFTPSAPLPPVLPQATQAISIATAQIGKEYVWGGAGPNTFDCSGLMQWSWAQVGVHLPRVAADQQSWATPVPISDVQPGDLVFFGNPAHHVGMYVGDGLMVEAPHTGATVDLTSIWWDDLAGFGRVHQ